MIHNIYIVLNKSGRWRLVVIWWKYGAWKWMVKYQVVSCGFLSKEDYISSIFLILVIRNAFPIVETGGLCSLWNYKGNLELMLIVSSRCLFMGMGRTFWKAGKWDTSLLLLFFLWIHWNVTISMCVFCSRVAATAHGSGWRSLSFNPCRGENFLYYYFYKK